MSAEVGVLIIYRMDIQSPDFPPVKGPSRVLVQRSKSNFFVLK